MAEAKGLEFDFVVVADFFHDCQNDSWYAVEEFLLKQKRRGRYWKRPTQTERLSSAAAALRTPCLVHHLKALYVAITRARFGCAFVESGAGSAWRPIVEYWQNQGLVTFVDGAAAFAKLSEHKAQDSPPRSPAEASLDSVPHALKWLWAELKLRTGPEHKKARKALGQERLRLQGGGALDAKFAEKFLAAHGTPSHGGRQGADSIPVAGASLAGKVPADLTALAEVLQLHSDLARTTVAVAHAIRMQALEIRAWV